VPLIEHVFHRWAKNKPGLDSTIFFIATGEKRARGIPVL
jgi:hypothetical protein